MRIAVDTRGPEEYQKFIYETFKRIAVIHPEHSFIFILNESVDSPFNFSQNIIPVVVTQSKISWLPQPKISSLLKKYTADVLVTGQGLNTNKPQCLIAFDKFTSKSLMRAKVIVTASLFSKKEISEAYKIEENKIDVVYNGVNEFFKPIESEEKEKIKGRYAGGSEYFLTRVTTKTDLLNLLKAFSVFKKIQKSSMQFLISSPPEMNKEFSEALRLYKFKSEVKLPENIGKKELAGITGAAYAFVYPGEEYVNVFPAMRSNVPVITNNAGVMQEVCRDAALYFNSNDHKDIADKMMLVYKDEKLRQQIIEKGREQVKKYSWDNSAKLLWKSIEKAYR